MRKIECHILWTRCHKIDTRLGSTKNRRHILGWRTVGSIGKVSYTWKQQIGTRKRKQKMTSYPETGCGSEYLHRLWASHCVNNKNTVFVLLPFPPLFQFSHFATRNELPALQQQSTNSKMRMHYRKPMLPNFTMGTFILWLFERRSESDEIRIAEGFADTK